MQLNCYTDFNKNLREDTLILDEGLRFLFTPTEFSSRIENSYIFLELVKPHKICKTILTRTNHVSTIFTLQGSATNNSSQRLMFAVTCSSLIPKTGWRTAEETEYINYIMYFLEGSYTSYEKKWHADSLNICQIKI